MNASSGDSVADTTFPSNKALPSIKAIRYPNMESLKALKKEQLRQIEAAA
jgi:hypothetical protein